MNTRLLRRVARELKREPRKLDMNDVAYTVDPKLDKAHPPCGTVGCIAGWACILSGDSAKMAEWERGRNFLQLTDGQDDRLFNIPWPYDDGERNWPKKFALRYLKAKTQRGRMLATVARIEHFIATKGEE